MHCIGQTKTTASVDTLRGYSFCMAMSLLGGGVSRGLERLGVTSYNLLRQTAANSDRSDTGA